MSLVTNQIAAYKLDESSGNAADAIGGVTLTNNGSTAYAAAKINNGADFGSSNSTKSLTTSNTLGINGGNISVSAWIKPTSYPSSDSDPTPASRFNIFGCSNSSAGVSYFMHISNVSGTIKVIFSRWRNSVAIAIAEVAYTPPTGSFTHVVGTYDGTTLKVYVDNGTPGTNTTSGTGSGGPNGTSIGSNHAPGAYFSGIIDEVYVWDRAITAAEVTELYNSGAGKQYPYSAAYTQSLTEAISLVDVMTRRTGKQVTEAVTLVEVVAKRTARLLTDVITLVAGSTAGKISTKAFSDSISLVDSAATKTTAKILIEAIALVDAITVRFSVKYLIEAIGLSDTIVATRLYARAFIDTITLNDSIAQVIALGRHFYETISLTLRWQGLKNGLNINNVRRYLDRAGTYVKRYLNLP